MTRICLVCMARGCKHGISKLTPREEDILGRLLRVPPPSHKELAYQIGIAEGTLRELLNRLFRKMGFGGPGSTIQVVLWVHQHQTLLKPFVDLPKPEYSTAQEMVNELRPPRDWKNLLPKVG